MNNLDQIVSYRIGFISLFFILTACSSTASSKVEENSGPFSSFALNEIANKDPESLVRIGQGFERTGDIAGAARLYDMALAAKPGLVSAQVGKARMLKRIGKTEEVIAILTSVMKTEPANEQVALELSDAYVIKGDYQKALAILVPLLEKPRASSSLLGLAGRVSELAGDQGAARIYFDEALKKSPGNAVILSYIALSFALDGQFDTAISLLQPLLNRGSSETLGRKTLALIYALSGQDKAADHIAGSIIPETELRKLRYYYQVLSKLNRRAQASAVFFDRIPKDALQPGE